LVVMGWGSPRGRYTPHRRAAGQRGEGGVGEGIMCVLCICRSWCVHG
jgi:hypothetical protein